MKIDQSPSQRILFLFLELLLLSIIILIIPLFMFIDLTILENGMSELSMIELTQGVVLITSAIILYLVSLKQPDSKGLFILIAGLFAAMFIREGDYFLDKIVHGFWKVPVLILLITMGYFAFKNRGTILKPLLRHSGTKAFTFMLIGFLITIAFSRVFGTGKIWREILNDNEHYVIVKTAIQEGLELLGYILIFYGAILLHLYNRNDPKYI